MQALPLLCHRNTPSAAVAGMDVTAQRLPGNGLHFRYVLRGDIARITVPGPAVPQHTDGLWRHTCFEAFISTADDSAYVECNFAPSGAWAAYRFAGYRRRMATLTPLEPPRIALEMQADQLILDARLRLAGFATLPLRIGISAVIEESDARLSYWALRHPRAKPDFHHRSGFILRLAAPTRPSHEKETGT